MFPYVLSFFFNLVEKNLLRVKKFVSVAKMALLVYERENCSDYQIIQILSHTMIIMVSDFLSVLLQRIDVVAGSFPLSPLTTIPNPNK